MVKRLQALWWVLCYLCHVHTTLKDLPWESRPFGTKKKKGDQGSHFDKLFVKLPRCFALSVGLGYEVLLHSLLQAEVTQFKARLHTCLPCFLLPRGTVGTKKIKLDYQQVRRIPLISGPSSRALPFRFGSSSKRGTPAKSLQVLSRQLSFARPSCPLSLPWSPGV